MRRRDPSSLLLLAAAALAGCAHAAATPAAPAWPLPCHLLKAAPGPSPAPTAARVPAPPPPPPLLITGATLWTATGKAPFRGDLLVERGRIAAIGARLSPPAGARVVDARGRHVTPGMIDPHSHMGVYPAPALRAHGDGNEMVKPTTPEVRAGDALWPQDPALPRALAAGVTLVHIIPGSGNLIGGQGIVARTLPGLAAEALRFRAAPRTMKMACGENPKRVYRNKGGPMTRMGSVARMRAALEAARRYRDAWRRYRRKRALWREGLRRRCEGAEHPPRSSKPDEVQPPEPPARDLGLEALVGVLEGRVKVHWHCYRADEMLNLMRLARRYGFTVQAFHHAVEAYKIRDALAKAGTAAVSWVNWWGFKAEAYDAIPENVALVASAGATASLHSDSPLVLQRYNQEGALAYFRGLQMGLKLPPDAGVAFVTREPAKVLGVERLVGTLEVGKLADLVLWDRSPLSVYARVRAVYVQGRKVYPVAAGDDRGPRQSDFELGLVPRPAPLPAAEGFSAPPLGRKLAPPPGPGGPAVAIVGGEVHTLTGPPLPNATVIVRGGHVAAVGAGLAVPAGARVIEARGLPVTPGLIAAESTIGLVEVDLEPSARDDRAASPRPHADVFATMRIVEAFNPASATVGVNRIEGLTTALLRPMGFLVAGQGAAVALDGEAPDIARPPVAMHAFLSRYGRRDIAGSRAATLARLRQLLADARLLAKVRGKVDARRFRDLSAPVEELAALGPVVTGRLPLVVHVHRAVEIRALLALTREAKIRLVLSGAGEAWKVAREIAAAEVPVVVEVDANLPLSFDRLAGRYDAAARLQRAGVKVVISAAGQAHNARVIRQLAGIAVAWGLPHEAALAALTRNPAEVFGLADRGVIAPGARADLVVWSGDPFELSTRVRHLLIGGHELPLTSRQTLLRERYRILRPRR